MPSVAELFQTPNKVCRSHTRYSHFLRNKSKLLVFHQNGLLKLLNSRNSGSEYCGNIGRVAKLLSLFSEQVTFLNSLALTCPEQTQKKTQSSDHLFGTCTQGGSQKEKPKGAERSIRFEQLSAALRANRSLNSPALRNSCSTLVSGNLSLGGGSATARSKERAPRCARSAIREPGTKEGPATASSSKTPGLRGDPIRLAQRS